jgi:hypothetical protein
MRPLDFYLEFIVGERKCVNCGQVFDNLEGVKQHCRDQPCLVENQESLMDVKN